MFFSICIPAYNRGYIITRALDSIVCQEFNSYEVIIVDDGSTDDTECIVKEYIRKNNLEESFSYYKKENGGKHSALNIGIEKAKGLFFLILDSDDWLAENALQLLYDECSKIANDPTFCGVMGRMTELKSGEIEGSLFDLTNPVSSYFDFHFLMRKEGKRFNCVEANKTEILKQYRYPEKKGMKFVPEAWLFDQIGVKYNLLLTNKVFRYSEYMPDGMNADKDFKVKHNIGFLYHYISRLENVLPYKKLSPKTKLKLYGIAWLQYWNCVHIDRKKEGPRVKHVTLFGATIRYIYPIIYCFASSKFDR